MKGRNEHVDLYRILFTAVICLHHGSALSVRDFPLRHGYMCVEFFFMLSGFYLYQSFEGEQAHDLASYIKRRLKRLYPEYFLAAALAILFWGILPGKFDLSRAAAELLMLQNTGPFHTGGYNYPCWYAAVMMVSGILLYGILCVRKREFLQVFGPLLVILGYTYLTGMKDGIEEWECVGGLSLPLLRGLCGMTAGILAAALAKRNGEKQGLLPVLLEAVCLILMALGLFTDVSSEMLTAAACAGLVYAAGTGRKDLGGGRISRTIGILSGYCYTFFLHHALVIGMLSPLRRVLPPIVLIPVFFAVLSLCSIGAKKASGALAKRIGAAWEKAGAVLSEK